METPLQRLCLLIFGIFVASCGEQEPSISPKERDQAVAAIVIDGPVSRDLFSHYQREYAETGAKTLIISSIGGDNAVAVEWGAFVQRHDIAVTARRVCASACASHIWASSRLRSVEPDTFLAFHTTSESNRLMISALKDGAVSPSVVEKSDAEKALYRSGNIAEKLLTDPAAHLDPVCGRFGADGKFQLVSRYGVWVPTRQQLEGYGIGFTGPWPQSRAEVEAVLDRVVRSGQVRFSFGDEVPVAVSALKECPESLPVVVGYQN